MRKYLVIVALAIMMGFPNLGIAASVKNEDNKVHQIKGRKPGKDWVYREINPRGALYFPCRHGCEIVLEETGSSVTLEKDADVVIRKGELRVK